MPLNDAEIRMRCLELAMQMHFKQGDILTPTHDNILFVADKLSTFVLEGKRQLTWTEQYHLEREAEKNTKVEQESRVTADKGLVTTCTLTDHHFRHGNPNVRANP